jgi:DNA invertase Pin-like site-specific DNA recombinase
MKDVIRERVKADLKNAKRKGKRLGRPPIPKRFSGKIKS